MAYVRIDDWACLLEAAAHCAVRILGREASSLVAIVAGIRRVVEGDVNVVRNSQA